MFCFIHAADLHLDSPLVGLEGYRDAPVEQIRNAARRAFDNLVELAISRKTAFVLLAGDIFDVDWKDHNSGIYFMNRLGRLKAAGIRVFMVSGNHDAASQISRALILPENVTLFSHRRPETRVLEEMGVAVHGQSFSARATSDDLSRNYPPALSGFFNIGLLHTSVTGRPGHEPYAPCSVDGLRAKGYDYWALGHVHQREELSRDPWILFPGNIQGRHVREAGAKGCTLVSVGEGHVLAVDPHDLDVLRWHVSRLDVSRCDSVDVLVDLVRRRLEDTLGGAEGRPVAVRLVLEGCAPIHALLHQRLNSLTEQFREIAAGLADVWLEKVIVNTRKSITPEECFPEDTPLSAIGQGVRDLQGRSMDLFTFMPEFEQFRNKLPPELAGDGELFPSGPEGLGSLCEEVKELLMERMLRRGAEDED